MINFKIITALNEIASHPEWIDSVNFKNKIVDENGHRVGKDYIGHRYEVVAKQERKFSKWERFERVLLGIRIVVKSFGKEWSSKTVKNLFKKDHESRNFGILINPQQLPGISPKSVASDEQLPLINEEKQDEILAPFGLENLLPQELNFEIFSYLDEIELARCSLVNKTWKGLASDEALWKALIPKIAFGKTQWEKYFGDIGEEPPLPKDIHKILKSPCPFCPGKKVEETHMLVLIPKTIDDKPLTLKTLGDFVKTPKKGNATNYSLFNWDKAINEHGNQTIIKSYWVLMKKNVIKGSESNIFKENYKANRDPQAFIDKFSINKRIWIDYKVPNLLDAAICIFMHYVRFGECLFDRDSGGYIRCQEKIGNYGVVIGFSSQGLQISSSYPGYNFLGITATCKLGSAQNSDYND
jgi:hypothetical protein